MKISWVVLCIGIVCIGIMMYFSLQSQKNLIDVQKPEDVAALFAYKTPEQIKLAVDAVLAQVKEGRAKLLAIPADKRTYENTVQALDTLVAASNYPIVSAVLHALEMVHPDTRIHDAAHDAIVRLDSFYIDQFAGSKEIYDMLKVYAQGPGSQQSGSKEQLTDEQRYFLNQTLDEYKRQGLELPEQERAEVIRLKKELVELTLKFNTTIAHDNKTITIPATGLTGLDDDFIKSLKLSADGGYIIPIDQPTYQTVMEYCSVPETRKTMWVAYTSRAYPTNKQVLEDIIAKRDMMAKKLGFASYAAYDTSNQMVKTPEHAEKFLRDLLPYAQRKVNEEIAFWLSKVPGTIETAADGKIFPWDGAFLKATYKKNVLALDERQVAEYFPTEKTVDGLLKIYEQFFSIRFERLNTAIAWSDEVIVLKVVDAKTNVELGYFLLDLFPRERKYNHACHSTITPATFIDGKPNKAVSVVIANFPRATASKPSLLKYKDVNTFFHEFGHALHALFGRVSIASLAGTNTKTDFVEMPSQMLEEWLYDQGILQSISSHYQTGQPLPEDMIKTLISLKTFDSGSFLSTQAYYALLSLAYFGPGQHKDADEIMKKLYQEIRTYVVYDPQDHFYASFGHLSEYAAKYYGYLWSKVFALDLFQAIKQAGLLNPEMGQKYTKTILAPGGTQDPNSMLEKFLGRAPSQEAFLKDLGFMK